MQSGLELRSPRVKHCSAVLYFEVCNTAVTGVLMMAIMLMMDFLVAPAPSPVITAVFTVQLLSSNSSLRSDLFALMIHILFLNYPYLSLVWTHHKCPACATLIKLNLFLKWMVGVAIAANNQS